MGQASMTEGAWRRRGSPPRRYIWLPALVALMAFVGFPAAAGAAPLAAAAAPPVNTGLPAIKPPPPPTPQNEVTNPTVGIYLLGVKGTWTGAAYTKLQWEDCDAAGANCTAIPGAINSSYKITDADLGHTLVLLETAFSSPGSSASASSAPTGVVTLGKPLNRTRPTVSGVTQDGQTLTTNPGTWDGTGAGTPQMTFAYQYRRCDGAGLHCGAAFPSPASASPTYVLQDVDLGHTMVAFVTATNAAGSTSVHSSVTTTVVTPANTALPTVSGTAQEGKTLTESHGSWIPKNPAGYSYQWQDCDASGNACAAIAGATSQSYTATKSDVGHTVRVLESATAGGITSSPTASAATGVVKPGTPAPGGSGNSGGGQGGGQNGNPSSGSGSTTVPAHLNSAKVRAVLLKALGVKGKSGTIRGVLKHSGYTFSFAAPSPGRLVISWYSAPAHGRKVLVATVSLVFHRSGLAHAVVFLTSSGRRLLSGATAMKLTAKGAFTPLGHGTIHASKRITLKA